MSYFLDANKISLDDLRKRLESTDLVPSRESLLDGLSEKFEAFKQHGLITLASLRKELGNPKRIAALSNLTAIDPQYLILLRREIESYFPKPHPLIAFDWLSQAEIEKLIRAGITDSAALYQATKQPEDRKATARSTGVDAATLDDLTRLVDLTRIQWVSPTTARMLAATGYDSPSKIASANAEDLCAALEKANAGARFFKGKIGLRDVKRLVHAAGYVD